jgi:hypothetical protein
MQHNPVTTSPTPGNIYVDPLSPLYTPKLTKRDADRVRQMRRELDEEL